MKTIDNNSAGDCMYDAYSISLMYYLRGQAENKNALAIFKTLQLVPGDEAILIDLLDQNKNVQKPFSSLNHREIQRILSPACRQLAAVAIQKEFEASPTETQLFAVAASRFITGFKSKLPLPYKTYVVVERNTALVNAEFFSVKELVNAVDDFATQSVAGLGVKFDQELKKIKTDPNKTHLKQKQELMDKLIGQKVIEFFTLQTNKHLSTYCKHIQTRGVWGSEETLLTLHRYITGETKVRDEKTKKCSYHSKIPITLGIAKNGVPTFFYETDPDLILNNIHNRHWLSFIPENFLIDPQKTIVLDAPDDSPDDTSLKANSVQDKAKDSSFLSLCKKLKSINATIDNATIRKHVRKIITETDVLYNDTSSEDEQRDLCDVITATIHLLSTTNMNDRRLEVAKYRALAACTMQGRAAPAWKALGGAMLVLGGAVALCGCALVVGGWPLVGLAMVGGGTLAGYLGTLFFRAGGLSRKIYDLAELVEEQLDGDSLLSPS